MPQALRHGRPWFFAAMVVSLCGCTFVSKKEFEAFKELQRDANSHNTTEHFTLRQMIERERTLREADVRQVASRAACDNEKLREFLRECEEGSDVCSEKGVNNAWKFITTQPGVELFLRPHSGGKGIIATRRGQLLSLVDPKTWLPSTRFLILVKPRSDSAEHHEEAIRVGREVKNYLVEDLLSNRKNVHILGPKAMPCKMKMEEVNNYTGLPLPYPLKGEPQSRDPTVNIWVFRTDC